MLNLIFSSDDNLVDELYKENSREESERKEIEKEFTK